MRGTRSSGYGLPVSRNMATLSCVKTTFDLPDPLLARAKQHARKVGKPLRALVEEGLRRVLDARPSATPYVLHDSSVGRPDDPNPLETMSWQDLRDEIYGAR